MRNGRTRVINVPLQSSPHLVPVDRRYAASRHPDDLGAMPGLFFIRHAARASCRPPAIAQPAPHLRHPIMGLFFQHINRVIRQVLPPTRHYCTSPPRSVTHSTQRYNSRWYYEPWKVSLATAPLLGIGGAVVIPDYYGYLETVPFTNRTHIVLRSPLEEREHSDTHFACKKEKYASIILDPHHPDCVRLNNITSKLVRAVHNLLIMKRHATVVLDGGSTGSAVEVLKRKLGSARRAQPATGHLDGLNWEVMVVKDKRHNMWCYPAGKIIATTGFLQVSRTDAELAAMISHEVGHVVARHWAEKKIYWNCLPKPLRVPFFRRVEREADLIGLMVLAAAGFDPRVAPPAFEKLGHSGRFLSNYPSSKKRAQLISQSKIMEEALKLYRQVSPDQDTRGVFGRSASLRNRFSPHPC